VCVLPIADGRATKFLGLCDQLDRKAPNPLVQVIHAIHYAAQIRFREDLGSKSGKLSYEKKTFFGCHWLAAGSNSNNATSSPSLLTPRTRVGPPLSAGMR
jgi:hypothetical protein